MFVIQVIIVIELLILVVLVALCYNQLRKETKSNYSHPRVKGLQLRSSSSNSMTCPGNYPLCGVLVVESGLGSGNYGISVGVHGLWPETGSYGSSQCIAPQDTTFDSSNIGSLCSNINEAGSDGSYAFANHEWNAHGQCSGGPGPASAYFSTMCQLAAPIISLLQNYSDWDSMVQAIQNSSYSQYLWATDTTNMQFEFSVCSNGDGNWSFCNM